MAKQRCWPWITGLATVGMIDSLYLLIFQTGGVQTVVCPIFRNGCSEVAASPLSHPAGVPSAMLGVIGYGAAALLATMIPVTQGMVKVALSTFLMAGSVGALTISMFLVYAQKTETHAWCFWCLISACVSVLIAVIAVPAGRRVFSETLNLRHTRRQE